MPSDHTKRLLRSFVPHGVIGWAKARRELSEHGIDTSVRRWHRMRDIADDAEAWGLTLMPKEMIARLDYLVDVGANVGHWAAGVLRCIQPKAMMCIEPSPVVIEELRLKLGNNPVVQIKQVIAGARRGEEQFHVTSNSCNASVLKPQESMGYYYQNEADPGWSVKEVITLPKETLDELLKDWPEVSLIKLDVQGYERFVLAGASEVLKRTMAVLIELNFVPHYDNDMLFNKMHELLTETYGLHLLNISAPWTRCGQAIFADALYVNPAVFPVGPQAAVSHA